MLALLGVRISEKLGDVKGGGEKVDGEDGRKWGRTVVDHGPPGPFLVDGNSVDVVRQQVGQVRCRLHARLRHTLIEIRRTVALVLDPTLESAEAGTCDQDLYTVVVKTKQNLLTLGMKVELRARVS